MATNTSAEQKYSVVAIAPTNFPGKVWNLVNNPKVLSICWDDSGEGILIHQERFKIEVLMSCTSDYFKTTRFNSFIRQLNLYGFRKVARDHDTPSVEARPHHFHNPNFKQDKPELLFNLQRLTAVNKAKLNAGMRLTNRTPTRFRHVVLNSSKENSAVLRTGSVLVGHQGTPYPHHPHGPWQHRVLMDSPHAPTSNLAHVHQGVMSHHSQYRFYTPVCQYLSPGFMDSEVPCSEQTTASYSHCGYYPTRMNKQDPYWKAGDVPESRNSDQIGVNLDTVFKIADELQAATDGIVTAAAPSHLRRQPQ